MNPRSEQALGGLFVIVATAVLVGTLFAFSGAFGDNHLEILPGTPKAALALDGAQLTAENYVDFNAISAQINDLGPHATELIATLNDRATELKVTVERVNDLLSVQNRVNLSAALANTRGMLEENRPALHATLQHINSVSEKLEPLLADFRKTSDEANKAIDHIDSLVGENRADIRQAVAELRRTLTNMTDLTSHLNQTLDFNSENIDELLDNFRHVSENLREFTNTIKSRPYTLIRSSNPREHKPGENQ